VDKLQIQIFKHPYLEVEGLMASFSFSGPLNDERGGIHAHLKYTTTVTQSFFCNKSQWKLYNKSKGK